MKYILISNNTSKLWELFFQDNTTQIKELLSDN
jgi:hypothetical protein